MHKHATRQWIGLVHPDLGIGGAERLIVDIALKLAQNDRVMLYTAHHDTKHCFKETLLEGERVHWIQERGNFIPTSIFGFCHVLCSNLRSAWASLRMLFELGSPKTVIIDQAIMPVLIFRLFSKAQVIFYCHFPDKLLTRRSSILRRLYRLPFDALEGLAMKSVCSTSCGCYLLRPKPRIRHTKFWSIVNLHPLHMRQRFTAGQEGLQRCYIRQFD